MPDMRDKGHSFTIRLHVIPFGYRLEINRRTWGSVESVATDSGRQWAARATLGGDAPLDGNSPSIHQAAKKIVNHVKAMW